MGKIIYVDFELGLSAIKTLKEYNKTEIKDFMNGSNVMEVPRFSKNFERRLQEAITRYKNAPNLQ